MSTFGDIEHLDVIENITLRFFTHCVDISLDSLPLYKLEKALGYSIIMAVFPPANAADYMAVFKRLCQSGLLN